MIIQMVYQMSGGRYDDRQWPMPWINFEVTDEEGRGLISCGAAMEVVQLASDSAAPEPVIPEPAVSEPQPADPVPAPEPAVPAEEIPVPLNKDPVAAWAEYAVSRGASPEEAGSMTKAQLQAAYGGGGRL